MKVLLLLTTAAILVMIWCCVQCLAIVTVRRVTEPERDTWAVKASGCVRAVMEGGSSGGVDSTCTIIYISDGTPLTNAVLQTLQLQSNKSTRVGAVFHLTVHEDNNNNNNNNSTQDFSALAPLAREVRQRSWCSVVVVVSESPTFLARVAEWSLKGRLLVWSTKMLVVTRLALHHLLSLLPYHWTFSMMNTVVLNLEHPRPNTSERCVAYSYLPYSARGARGLQVASWTQTQGLALFPGRALFPQKYNNFHGMPVNITALPYKPYWDEVKTLAPDGSPVTEYYGSDYQLLLTVSTALNFTIRLVPTSSWIKATQLVGDRVSFICAVYHILMPVRFKMHDFTVVYEFSHFSFASYKPGLRPQWLSVYYPLAGEVWLAVLAILGLIPLVLYMVKSLRPEGYGDTLGVVVQDMIGLLLGQNLPPHLPRVTSTRILVAFWLIYALILSASYRGNLTAALTLPQYPHRPETLNQLVQSVEKVTIPPYGEQHRKFYSESDSPLFQALAKMLIVGPTTMQGLKALSHNAAHLGGRRYLQQKIAERFTAADGSTELYVGREFLFPGPSGWPIPHDAPYKPQLDRCITAATEAGLYEKWVSDMSRRTVLESQRRLRQQQTNTSEHPTRAEERLGGDQPIPALTITHLQGPFMILVMGLVVGFLILMVEICWFKIE